MAKITPGSLAGQVSGSVGNDVFSHNRYGSYIRKRVKPTLVVNTYTLGARQRLVQASQGWGALTAAQQEAWRTWANSNPITDRLGYKQVLAGNAAYVQLNARVLQAGGSLLTDPPTVGAPGGLLTLTPTCDIGLGDCELAFTGTPLAAGLSLYVQAAVLTNPGQNYVKNKLKLIVISSAAQASPLNVETELVARFGTLQVGQRVTFLVSVLDTATGLLSSAITATVAVTTT